MRIRLTFPAILAFVVAVFMPYTALAAEISGAANVVSARVAAEEQLVELGINPGDAVFQAGSLNYAGPDCPGSGWNCTSALTVVQIGDGPTIGTNVVDCGTPGGDVTGTAVGKDRCVVVQVQTTGTATNTARCVEQSSADPISQVCKIFQQNVGGTNSAFVDQRIAQFTSIGKQIGDQVAKVRQINGTGANHSTILQILKQKQTKQIDAPFGALLQKQEGHQRALVCQGGGTNGDPCVDDSNGENRSSIAQTNLQNLNVAFADGATAAISQQQNTCASPGLVPAGCDFSNTTPKSLARVHQNSVAPGCNTSSPCNSSDLLQRNRQVARVYGVGEQNDNNDENDNDNENDNENPAAAVFAGTVNQQQGIVGNPLCPDGGLCGWVDQHTSVAGVENAIQFQNEVQRLLAPKQVSLKAVQAQYGPEFCCATQLPGNVNNVNTTTQSKVQKANGTTEEGNERGHCKNLGGTCKVLEKLKQDNFPAQSNSCSGPICGPAIDCFTAPGEAGGVFHVCTPTQNNPPLPETSEGPFGTTQCPDPQDPSFCGRASPTLTTLATPSAILPDTIQDTATLAGGNAPTGTITFTLYGPNDATCASTEPITRTAAVSGNGPYSSGAVTVSQAGTYRWIASYSGDAANSPVSTKCNDAGETTIVSIIL